MKKIDNENTHNIVCPYCGYEDKDSWEFSGELDEDVEISCERCEKSFIAIKNIYVLYSTYKIDEL